MSDAPPSVGGWVEVSNAAQLEYIDQNQSSYLGSNIELMNNIDLTGYNSWVPFGSLSTPYNWHTFNGQGHEITGVVINDTTDQFVGFFGAMRGTVENVGINAHVTGTPVASGKYTDDGVLAGIIISGGGSISNSYATGTVSNGNTNGGLVGELDGTISDSYSMVNVSGPADGGLVGFLSNGGSITDSYAVGQVPWGNGGIVAEDHDYGFISSSPFTGVYFDTLTTGVGTGVGMNENGGSTSGITGQPTTAMQTESTFSGWDFTNTWGIAPNINNGYPYLRALYSSYIPNDVTPPSTQATVTGKQRKNGWYVSPVQLTLNATDDLSGVAATSYSTDGGTTWRTYTAPLSFSEDGKYNIEYFSVDNAGNKETPRNVNFNIDQTPPTINVTSPTKGSYLDDASPTVTDSVNDNVSGVNNSSITSTFDGQPITNGTTIALYTLSLGVHTLTVSAADNAGNTATQSVTFQLGTSVDSLNNLVSMFTNNGSIDNAGIANALTAKLNSGALRAFANQINAQSGKHISATAAAYLLRDANYLLGQ